MRGKGKKFVSLNPATDSVIWQGKSATAPEVTSAFKAARRAFTDWAKLPLEKRQEFLLIFARQIEKNKSSLATLISQETGKPLWESAMEAALMVKKIEISIRAYQERCAVVVTGSGQTHQYTRFKPQGVVAVLGPFNLPGHLPLGHIVPALLAGDTVIFKPSELTPFTGEKIAGLMEEAGIPSGVINLVQGGRETGQAIAASPDLNGLYFTGSAKAGQAIHKSFAGRPEKIIALEMGGNNPFIISQISDEKTAAYLTVQSAFITSGQRCTCARRLIVVKNPKSDAFLQTLVNLVKKIQVGPFTDNPEPFMGTVISKEAARKILGAQSGLERQGGRCLVKTTALSKGAFLTPGIIDVTKVKKRPDEEVFGPLLQLIYVKNFNEAIAEANNTVFGLSAGLLSEDKQEYEKFYQQVHAGIVNWNQPTTGASSQAPFGGVGLSGNHRPSAYYATDYCSYPVASIESGKLQMPEKIAPGINL